MGLFFKKAFVVTIIWFLAGSIRKSATTIVTNLLVERDRIAKERRKQRTQT